MPAWVVYVTAPPSEAGRIAETLVQEKLAACVNIIPTVHSTYWWKGQVEKGEESLLVIKTLSEKFKALKKRVEAIHSYSVPEIIALPVAAGNAAYLGWIKDSLTPGTKKAGKKPR
jgi:periplasmic divalent cation tolerance protein